ncbi:unnamed protein product [Clonostachys rosea]|uniref:Fungal-type protein kinase domain-containing protein n=1 Tax=Bionectria ochroleuca TaxID=29856 RepID=A0ABY6U6J7_BIOOC|nr:unnamed protein product [Clonostachys rosea]
MGTHPPAYPPENPPEWGPGRGQEAVPFWLLGISMGVAPFELTPEQEAQIRDGATQVKPRRQLMRWFFEQKLGVLQCTVDYIWMSTTRTFWTRQLSKGHTRVSRDSMLEEIDARVWDIIVDTFTAERRLFALYPFAPESSLFLACPFGDHPSHDETAAMSQEFDKFRERMGVPLVPDGSRTLRARPHMLEKLTDEEFRDWMRENELAGIISTDATNKYSDPFFPPGVRNKPRKDCSEKVKAIWEARAPFSGAHCPTDLLPGPFQVVVPHVPKLFKLPHDQDSIRYLPESRVIMRRQHFTDVFPHSSQSAVHRYAIGPDLDERDIQDMDQETVGHVFALWQIILRWALAVWSGAMIRFEEWLIMVDMRVYPGISEPRFTFFVHVDLIEASQKYDLGTLNGLVNRTGVIEELFKSSEKTRQTLATKVAKIQQNKERSYFDRVNDMVELVFEGQGRLPRLETNSPFEQHLLTVMWVISQSKGGTGTGSSVSAEEDMWPTVKKVGQLVFRRIVRANYEGPFTLDETTLEASASRKRPGPEHSADRDKKQTMARGAIGCQRRG